MVGQNNRNTLSNYRVSNRLIFLFTVNKEYYYNIYSYYA